jgi:hypothetical protein
VLGCIVHKPRLQNTAPFVRMSVMQVRDPALDKPSARDLHVTCQSHVKAVELRCMSIIKLEDIRQGI